MAEYVEAGLGRLPLGFQERNRPGGKGHTNLARAGLDELADAQVLIHVVVIATLGTLDGELLEQLVKNGGFKRGSAAGHQDHRDFDQTT